MTSPAEFGNNQRNKKLFYKLKHQIIFFFLMLLFLLVSCKKDKSDLLLGVWDLESLVINGNDSTSAAKSQSCYKKIEFLEEDKTKGTLNTTGVPYTVASCVCSGSYALSMDYKHLSFSLIGGDYIPIGAYRYSGGVLNWNVQLLTENNMHLDIVFNGNHNDAWFKKD